MRAILVSRSDTSVSVVCTSCLRSMNLKCDDVYLDLSGPADAVLCAACAEGATSFFDQDEDMEYELELKYA